VVYTSILKGGEKAPQRHTLPESSNTYTNTATDFQATDFLMTYGLDDEFRESRGQKRKKGAPVSSKAKFREAKILIVNKGNKGERSGKKSKKQSGSITSPYLDTSIGSGSGPMEPSPTA
jgi:hypothetical protein